VRMIRWRLPPVTVSNEMRYREQVTIRCVECGSLDVLTVNNKIACAACSVEYAIVLGAPVFLKADGIFSTETAGNITDNGFAHRAMRGLSALMPSMSYTGIGARAKSRAIREQDRNGICLVIGAGDNVAENATLRAHFKLVVATDVSVNEGVDIVCDGHDLPFADDQFDFVILTAVLEHVLDPYRVVKEVSRVLKSDGTVFAVTPFMQQVHMGAFDFHRFTDLGHRWLFRDFVEVERGTCGGPATSLLWSLVYFAGSFGFNRSSTRAFVLSARLLFFWIKYFDLFLERRAPGRDAASGFYFVGKNVKHPAIDAKTLISLYIGHNR
jgi:SAM-dependent methyltransferase